jgi:acyl-CoA reductase-like NAD-dependent aldehyde dehydrogenase
MVKMPKRHPFGCLFGIFILESEQETLEMMKHSAYGLSAAAFTRNHFTALEVSKEISARAVHINGEQCIMSPL